MLKDVTAVDPATIVFSMKSSRLQASNRPLGPAIYTMKLG
jgi:hypothetical protein